MEVQNFKHVCKFCKKSFPCGRSLGGHIRSHLPKPGYELRENPKKTWRAVDHDDLLLNNSSFSSSSTETENPKSKKMNQNEGKRSNFAPNNSHSCVSEVVEAEQQEEVVVAMCLIMLSQDVGAWRDDITSSLATPENFTISQGKNSKSMKRRREKVQGKNPAFCTVNGKRCESAANGYVQKELKLKAIEISAKGFGSNDENSKNLESKRKKEKLQGEDSASGATDYAGKITKVESGTCGYVKNTAKSKEFEVLENGFVPNDQNKQPPESKRKTGQITASGCVKKGSTFDEFEASEDGIISYDQDHSELDTELCNKRSKFECTTCNKVFHSYQALGGHRASHKKLAVGGSRCSPSLSKLEENDIASTDVPPSPDVRKHPQSKQEQEQEIVPEMRIGSSSSSTTSSKKVVHQKHECPICFRVFPSGQALGGHKRSHLLVTSNADINGRISEVKKISNNQSSKFSEVVERLSSTESRDLFDLNFPPAPVQDETPTPSSGSSLVGFIKPYWCVESSHKHEPLLGLISN